MDDKDIDIIPRYYCVRGFCAFCSICHKDLRFEMITSSFIIKRTINISMNLFRFKLYDQVIILL